jgi:hypothetical protein
MMAPTLFPVVVACTAALLLHVRPGTRDAATQATLVEPARFHHLHLVAASPPWLADYYTRLFAPTKVTRGSFWSIDGVRGAEIYLLVSAPAPERQWSVDTAIWHFGWGAVSVGETYKRHYAREVNWKPPYAALEAGFHLHLRSRDPIAAGRWYRDVLGGLLEEGAPLDRGASEDDRAEALVRFHHALIVLHRWGGPLAPSDAGGTADHLAFTVRDPATIRDKARRPGEPDRPGVRDPLADAGALTIEGPDRVVIELLPAARGPAFWK